MGFKTVDMDNKEEYNEYKKKKNHYRFMKESQPVIPDPVDVKEVEKVERNLGVEDIKKEELFAKVVKIDKLRVRNYPEGDIIKLISKGTEVKILSDVDDCWYKVQLNDGTVGFCMKTYLLTYLNGETEGLNDSRRCKTCPTTK